MATASRRSKIWRLTLPLIVAVVALVFWNSILVYPLKILVVLFHELSHGIAAIVTGGAIERIEISLQEGGVCFTRGGSTFFILNAGYLGSLLWGALLLVVGTRGRRAPAVATALGGLLLVVTIVYIRSLFGFSYGFLVSVGLLWSGLKLPPFVSETLLTVIGVVSCLYAVWDIGSDVLFRTIPGSDAYRLAELTLIPSLVWGVLWVAAALVVTAIALRAAWANA